MRLFWTLSKRNIVIRFIAAVFIHVVIFFQTAYALFIAFVLVKRHTRLSLFDFFRFTRGSTSQVYQDVVVLALTSSSNQLSPSLSFLEIGAADGAFLSNTLQLERLGWHGNLIEPSSNFDKIQRGPNTHAHRLCLSDRKEVVEFLEADEITVMDRRKGILFSGIADQFDAHRPEGSCTKITAMTAADFFKVHLPDVSHINYVSIDTEGSELKILEAWPFDRVSVDVWTIEHNKIEPRRGKIHELLGQHGYRRLSPSLVFDDVYVSRQELIEKNRRQ